MKDAIVKRGPVAGGQLSDASTFIFSRPLFIVIFITGLSARLYKINASPWFDEIANILFLADNPWGTVLSAFNSANNHLLYSVLTKLLVSAGGSGIYAFRLVPFLTGALSIPAVYLLGTFIKDEKTGLTAAFFLAVSFPMIHYSQECRGYSGSILFSILSTYFFLLMAQGKGNSGTRLFYALSVAAGALFHLTFLFIFFSHVFSVSVTALMERGKKLPAGKCHLPGRFPRDFLYLSAAVSLGIAVCYLPMGRDIASTYSIFTKPVDSSAVVTWGFLTELFGYPFGLPFNRAAAILLSAAMACILARRFREDFLFTLFAFCLFTVPLALFKLINPASVVSGVLPVRFFIHLYHFIYIVAAIGITGFFTRITGSRHAARLGIALTAAVLASPHIAILNNYFSNGKNHWGEIFEYINRNAADGALITTNSAISAEFAFNYFNKQIHFEKRNINFVPWERIHCEDKEAEKWLIFQSEQSPSREKAGDLYQAVKKGISRESIFYETENYVKAAAFMGYGGHSSSDVVLYYSSGLSREKEGAAGFFSLNRETLENRNGLAYHLAGPGGESLSSGQVDFPGLRGIPSAGAGPGKSPSFTLKEEGFFRPEKKGAVRLKYCYSCGIKVALNGREAVSDLENSILRTGALVFTLPPAGAFFSIEYHHHPSCGKPVVNFFLSEYRV